MDTMYLDNLHEFIYDEKRIVTYKWLSLTLGVHANVAKQMLYHFVSEQRNDSKNDGDSLSVTYLVSGVVAQEDQEGDIHKIELVREENLEAVKAKMKDVMAVHIYSIQQSRLKDLSVLYSVNCDVVKEKLLSINKYSGIACLAAKIRSSEELLRYQQQSAHQTASENVAVQNAKLVEDKVVPKKEIIKEEYGAKTKSKTNQIASMFAKQATKSEDKKDVKISHTVPKKSTSAASKKQGGIGDFLSRGSIKREAPESPVKSEFGTDSPATSASSKYPRTDSEGVSSPLTESVLSSVKTESQESVIKSETDSVEMVSTPVHKGKAKTQSKLKPKKATQRRGRSKNSDKENPLPKRKRIMQLSDSDSSSDEDNEDGRESPFPSSPVPEPVDIDSDEEIPDTPQPESRQYSENGRPKIRKLINKTFTDEDGYLITKKEYEYVSDDEAVQSNEENIPSSKKTHEGNIPAKKTSPTKKMPSPSKKKSSPSKKKSSPSKKTSPTKSVNASPKKAPLGKKKSKDTVKTKQSSLMSFFGKK